MAKSILRLLPVLTSLSLTGCVVATVVGAAADVATDVVVDTAKVAVEVPV